MAVPQNITTTFALVTSGIFHASSQVYVLGNTGSASFEVEMWMAADPTAGAFAVQDAANQPNITNWNASAATIDGTDIIVIHGEDVNSGDVRLSVFHTATDLWSAQVDGDYEDLAFTGASQGVDGNEGQLLWVMRDLRTTGDPLVVTYMHEEKDMGVDFRNIHVGSRAATTGDAVWTHRGRVSPTNGVAYVGGGLLLGTSNITHCFFYEFDNLRHRTFSSGWTLNGTTQSITTDVNFVGTALKLQTRYDVSSTIHLVVLHEDASGTIRAQKADSAESSTATWSSEVVSGADVGTASNPCITRDGSTVHAFWTDTLGGATDEVLHDVQDDGDTTWGTDETVHSENNRLLHSVSQDPYDYGEGNVFGFVMGSGTSGVYDEYALAAPVTINVPAGSMVLAGQTPVRSIGVNRAPGAGALVLAGVAPTAGVSVNALPGSGTLVLAGAAPALQFDQRYDPPAGTLTLAGLAPTAGISPRIDVPSGTLVVAGLAPLAIQAYLFAPPAGALVVGGLAPLGSIGFNLAVPAGTLVLAGIAPQVVLPLDIPTGALVLSGQAPDLIIPVVSAHPSGTLLLRTEKPSLGFTIAMPLDDTPC